MIHYLYLVLDNEVQTSENCFWENTIDWKTGEKLIQSRGILSFFPQSLITQNFNLTDNTSIYFIKG